MARLGIEGKILGIGAGIALSVSAISILYNNSNSDARAVKNDSLEQKADIVLPKPDAPLYETLPFKMGFTEYGKQNFVDGITRDPAFSIDVTISPDDFRKYNLAQYDALKIKIEELHFECEVKMDSIKSDMAKGAVDKTTFYSYSKPSNSETQTVTVEGTKQNNKILLSKKVYKKEPSPAVEY